MCEKRDNRRVILKMTKLKEKNGFRNGEGRIDLSFISFRAYEY